MRGEIFEIEDVFIFTFGGDFSLDKARRTEGISWFVQEMPIDNEYLAARNNLITHTSPTESVAYLATCGGYDISRNVVEERSLTDFLQMLTINLDYKTHYFGHFHIDKELWRNQIAIFNAIREIKAGRGNSSVGILCGLGCGCILEYMNPYVND